MKILQALGILYIIIGGLSLIASLILIGNYNYQEQHAIISEGIIEGYVMCGIYIVISIIEIISGLLVTWWNCIKKVYVLCLLLGGILLTFFIYQTCTNIIKYGKAVGLIQILFVLLYVMLVVKLVKKEKKVDT